MTLEAFAIQLLNDSCYNKQDGHRIYSVELCCVNYKVHANAIAWEESGMPIDYEIIKIEKE